jgi:hypothetical protein
MKIKLVYQAVSIAFVSVRGLAFESERPSILSNACNENIEYFYGAAVYSVWPVMHGSLLLLSIWFQ